jgi:DNA-binding helix-hairpin-helix protein with protein kinase domain
MAQKNSREHASEAGKKEWHPPVLKKLPIAATAGASKHSGNEGGGAGKGDAGPPATS